MRKLTRVFIGLSVFAALMICMTAVSFAGTANQKVTVKFSAGRPGAEFYFIDDYLTVTGDLCEKYFPEVEKYEEKCPGVSFADALVAAHIKKYGADKVKENLTLADYGTWGAVAKQFGQAGDVFCYTNNISNNTGVCEAEIKNGDKIFCGNYVNGWDDLYSYFNKDEVTTLINQEAELEFNVDSYGAPVTLSNIVVKVMDPSTRDFVELPGATYNDGKVKVKFDTKGVYIITLDGDVAYKNYTNADVTAGFAGALAKVMVKEKQVDDSVTVDFNAAQPGSFDFHNEKLKVTGFLAEKYFPEIAEFECSGVSFADVLVAAHIAKYGEAGVRDYMSFAGANWMGMQFGHDIVGFYYDNNVSTPTGVNEYQVKNGAKLFAGSYTGSHYSDRYSFFDKNTISATTGKAVTLTLTTGTSIGDKDYGAITPMDSVSVMTVDFKTGKLTSVAGATYKKGTNNGTVTFKFNKAGTYYVTVDGKAKVKDYYGNDATVGCAGALCTVTVKDAKPAKPAKPVIKSAKRKSKTKGTVKWSKAKNAKKYEVAYRIKGTKKWKTKKTTKTSISLKLKAKKAYQVKVRSINGKLKSAYSKTKTIKKK